MSDWRIVDSDSKRLSDYKGYQIWKLWDIDYKGKRVNIQYQVCNQDDDWVLDFYNTLSEAKQDIDNMFYK